MDAQQTLKILLAARRWGQSVLIRDLARTPSRDDLREQVKRCRTVYWYEHLRERAAVQTVWAMQTAMAPDSFRKRPGEKRHSTNIWLKYRDGKHKPTVKTLRRVEALYPGSSDVISDRLWSLLLRDHFSPVSAQRLLKRLPESHKSALFKKDGHGRPQRNPHWERWSGPRSVDDFSQMSAFVILAREALQSGQTLAADKWGYKVFETFIHLGPKLMEYRVGRALFQVLDLLIFSRTDIYSNSSRYIELNAYPHPTAGRDSEHELENYSYWLDQTLKATCRMIYRDLRAPTLVPLANQQSPDSDKSENSRLPERIDSTFTPGISGCYVDPILTSKSRKLPR